MKHSILFLCILILISCSSNDSRLEQALDFAGENRTELEKVLKHYKNEPQKLETARFLIKNMPYHYYTEEHYRSPNGEKYRPDMASFKNKEQMEKHCDSLIYRGFKIERKRQFDITTIDSEYLINNIELAFQVWQKPWAKNVSFDDFCRYILPYRAQTENPSTLRKEMMNRFLPVLDSANATSPLQACIILNERLKNVIKYQQTGFPFYPTIEEAYRAGISRCEGMCNLGTFIMRAVGIPVTVDLTIWVKMDLGHSWCAVLDSGKFYSFGPGEDQPIEHAKVYSEKRFRRPAKVYRTRFDPVEYGKFSNDDQYKTHLKSALLYDVTEEYAQNTIQIQVPIDNPIKNKSDLLYLCVYNFYNWKPLAIGKRSGSMCLFDNVAGDNIFIVASCPDGENLSYVTAPFYVDLQGNISKFKPDRKNLQSHTMKKKEKNEDNTLFYWDVEDQSFIRLTYTEATDSTQSYNNIPDNSLLWLTIPKRIHNQRVFFIENDSLRIY